jgi:hypothetical protein
VKQITNDIYDDLDPSYVSLMNKDGIIFSSNRPSPYAKSADTVLPNNRYNIFLVTDFNTDKAELNRITQLTNLKFGDARYPTQYNNLHFTFVNDENGIGNRYAGFFSSQREGFDTLVVSGDDVLRNPTKREVDSMLRANKKLDVDTIAVVSVSRDSAYIFPLTNYASSLLETRAAGENNQVSEVTRQSDDKILYKLKIDENTLKRRNVSNPPTAYMKRILQQDKITKGQETQKKDPATKKQDDIFQNEFGDEKKDSSGNTMKPVLNEPTGVSTVLSKAKLFQYKPPKFSSDYLVSGFNNAVLVNRYQAYMNGQGPIQLATSTALNGIIRIGTSEMMEDLKFSGGYRLSTNLKDNDWLFQFQNLRKRLDWGFTFYRNVLSGNNGKLIANLYQANLIWPLDVARSFRLNLGVRRDRTVFFAFDRATLDVPEDRTLYGLAHLEYVYDNTLNPAQNIWNGSRYKIYMDVNRQLSTTATSTVPGAKYIFNGGFDARTYYPIYRNFIWAGRAAGDFSWGKQKLIYYLGGVDNWLMFGDNERIDNSTGQIKYKYFNPNNKPDPDNNYAFQSLAVNMRGFVQNVANGNNALVINSEFRLPVFTTLFSKPINNAFLRNFQLIQFIDLGTAWNGKYDDLKRPSTVYGNPPVQINIKQGGIGPFLGGYGFGARSTLLGYFIKSDVGWQMNGFFKGKPILYFSMGLDF